MSYLIQPYAAALGRARGNFRGAGTQLSSLYNGRLQATRRARCACRRKRCADSASVARCAHRNNGPAERPPPLQRRLTNLFPRCTLAAHGGRAMKLTRLVLATLLSILLVSGVACGGGISKPTFGYLPEGWILSEDNPDAGEPGFQYGELRCRTEDFDHVTIWYGDVDVLMPPPFMGSELDEETLIEIAKWPGDVSNPEETGTMIIAGELAGYVEYKGWSDKDCVKDIVCIKGPTYVFIWASWDCDDYSTKAVIESIIESINF